MPGSWYIRNVMYGRTSRTFLWYKTECHRYMLLHEYFFHSGGIHNRRRIHYEKNKIRRVRVRYQTSRIRIYVSWKKGKIQPATKQIKTYRVHTLVYTWYQVPGNTHPLHTKRTCFNFQVLTEHLYVLRGVRHDPYGHSRCIRTYDGSTV